MRWQGRSEITDAALAEVAGALEAAASAAPPSPRAAAIRAELLASLEAERRTIPLLRPLAIVAVVLLAAAIIIGAPAVGSFLERLDDLPPAPLPTPLPSADPSPSEPVAVENTPSPSPSPESPVVVESTEPAAEEAAVDPTLRPAATVAPDDPGTPGLQPTPADTGVAGPAAPPPPTPTPEPTPDQEEDVPCLDLPLLPCIPLPILPILPILP